MGKIRNGFVSNSSSSSFVCCISGDIESGWDISYEDAGMYECLEGHVFSEDYKVTPAIDKIRAWMISNLPELEWEYDRALKEEKDYTCSYDQKTYTLKDALKIKEDFITKYKAMTDEEVEEWLEEYECDNGRGELAGCFCPICTMEELSEDDIESYIRKKYSIKLDEIKKEVKEKFFSYTDFKKYLKN
jgi:hypothetical protein